jgi:hypothetical protein
MNSQLLKGNTAMERQASWEMLAFDPPDSLQAQALTQFIRGQQDQKDYPAEKEGIFKWKLINNNNHSGFASAMVAKEGGKIVSLCTVTPKRLWLEGKEKRWGEIGDTFTDQQYMRRGMFVSLVNATRQRAQLSGYKIIYGLPNEKSAPGYLNKLEFGIKENIDLLNYTLILSSRALAWWLQLRKNREFWWLSIAASLFKNPLSDAISRKLLKTILPQSQIKEIALYEDQSFGPEYDNLWQKVRDMIPVSQIRDANYLTWRYIENPFPFKILAAKKNNVLAGYLITLTQDEADGKIRRLYLVDWLFHPSEKHSIGFALLRAALEPTYNQYAHLVTALSPRQSAVSLPWKEFKFLRRPPYRPLIFHRNEDGLKLIRNTAHWHFTIGDTDVF